MKRYLMVLLMTILMILLILILCSRVEASVLTKKAGVKLVWLESETCPPSGRAAWHICPREEEEGVVLGPS